MLDTTPNEPLRYHRSVRLDADNPSKSDLTVWITTPVHDRVFSVATSMDDIQRVTMRDANGTVLREDEY